MTYPKPYSPRQESRICGLGEDEGRPLSPTPQNRTITGAADVKMKDMEFAKDLIMMGAERTGLPVRQVDSRPNACAT